MHEPVESRCDRIQRWNAGEAAGPWEMLLFLTNRCNLKCAICWQRWALEQFGEIDTKHELPDDRWEALIDEGAALGVREWAIVGGGEPLVRGELVMRLAERIRRHGMSGALHTNGTLFRQEYIERLVDAGFQSVVFSLDGPSIDVNDDIRSEGSFARATTAIKRFAEVKRARTAQWPQISISAVLTSTNHTQVDRMVRLFRELECDGSLRLAVLAVQGSECQRFELAGPRLAEAREHVAEAMALAHELGVPNNFEAVLQQLEGAPSAPASCEQTGGIPCAMCFEPWTTVLVQTDGKVGPCCVSYDEHADSLADKSFAEVWHGDYFATLRARAMNHDYFDYCKFCPSHVIARTEELRTNLRAALRRDEIARAPLLAGLKMRLSDNLRQRGLGGTARRAYEWALIRLRGR